MPLDHESIFERTRLIGGAKVLDVTLRDGGFTNNFSWSLDQILKITEFSAELESRFLELGYIGGVPDIHSISGKTPTLYVTPKLVSTISEHIAAHDTKLGAMIHPSSIKSKIDFIAFAKSGLSLVRFVYHPSWENLLIELHEQAREAGLLTSINLALVSRYTDAELQEAIDTITQHHPNFIYFADTCGALFPEDVTKIFSSVPIDRDYGFHAHDSMSMALVNSITASRSGSSLVDCSFCGLGRGGGNLRLEHWLGLTQSETIRGKLLEINKYFEDIGHPSLPANLSDFFSGALNLTPVQAGKLNIEP